MQYVTIIPCIHCRLGHQTADDSHKITVTSDKRLVNVYYHVSSDLSTQMCPICGHTDSWWEYSICIVRVSDVYSDKEVSAKIAEQIARRLERLFGFKYSDLSHCWRCDKNEDEHFQRIHDRIDEVEKELYHLNQ